jgi:peroxiredoxin
MVKVGQKIGSIKFNINGEEVHLDTFLGKKVVLFFYPKDNTSG